MTPQVWESPALIEVIPSKLGGDAWPWESSPQQTGASDSSSSVVDRICGANLPGAERDRRNIRQALPQGHRSTNRQLSIPDGTGVLVDTAIFPVSVSSRRARFLSWPSSGYSAAFGVVFSPSTTHPLVGSDIPGRGVSERF